MTGSGSAEAGYGIDDMIHRLPPARVVDRTAWLVEQCRGRRVVHAGFADAGFAEEHKRSERWLHGHLAGAASALVGIDVDPVGVASAVDVGYHACVADCTNPAAVAALGLEPADVVVAGEVIEHVDRPGLLLDGLRELCCPAGRLIVTTPNAGGLLNTVAAIVRGVEINHPDHVVMFTWRTLTGLMRRRGWSVVDTATYVPELRERGNRTRREWAAVRATLGAERILGRLGRPFAADGLIVTAVPVQPGPGSHQGPNESVAAGRFW